MLFYVHVVRGLHHKTCHDMIHSLNGIPLHKTQLYLALSTYLHIKDDQINTGNTLSLDEKLGVRN